MNEFNKFIATLVFGTAIMVWSGYVLSIMWGWFFAGTFGLPELSIPAAIGVSMTVNFMTYQLDADSGKFEEKKLVERVVVGFIRPAMLLLFGWIMTLFM